MSIKSYSANVAETDFHKDIQALVPKKKFYLETTVKDNKLAGVKYDDSTLTASEKQAITDYLAAKGLSVAS
jgi:hypothetical protein